GAIRSITFGSATNTANGNLTFSGGVATFDLVGTTTDLIDVKGALTLNHGTIFVNTNANSGTYNLFNYGTISGDPAPQLTPAYPTGTRINSSNLIDDHAGHVQLSIVTGAVITWT